MIPKYLIDEKDTCLTLEKGGMKTEEKRKGEFTHGDYR
jgi:hypothetical protein